MRYSSYHLDQSLQNLHQNYPWICVWDDHEFANNAYKDGAQNHDSNEGDWYERKDHAQKPILNGCQFVHQHQKNIMSSEILNLETFFH